MYEDFKVIDRWTGEELHCAWKGTVVAIATRHADATDIRFAVNKGHVWIAMPNLAWVEHKKRTSYVITDHLAAQIAGLYLQRAIQSGYDNGREMYTMTVAEVLELADVVVREAGSTDKLPSLPVINEDIQPELELGRLPADNQGPVQIPTRSHRAVAHVFARQVKVEYDNAAGETKPCPIAWIDNFAMRNFTNDAIFDDTLPIEDGLLEIGNRVPLDRLRSSMEDWFHRKSYLKPGETLLVTELSSHQSN